MYGIQLGSDIIGEASVLRSGLYYNIKCLCDLTGEVMYRIIVSCGDKQVDLGLCVPTGGQFGLEKRVPTKLLGDGELVFRLVPKHAKHQRHFVPIRADEPFAYLQYMENAFLEKRNEQVGAVIQAQLPDISASESS